ncbi:MAG: LacI family DNA-binding transcriptional regulator [Lentisphaeria bacterium]|nr:LacI family DNA-binding transcriptional regulator [Lentisphaeria bacterium]
MAVTIRDVAAKAEVSFQLASAVLGNKKYARAAAATRKKILDAARTLGYVPNISARILRGDSSKIIGVLIDTRAAESMYEVLAEIESGADELGYRILSAQAHDNPEKLLQAYYSLKQNGVDGIISFSHDYAQLGCHLDRQLKDDPKIVFVLNAPEGVGASVDVDYHGSMKAAVSHLTANGYRNPALLLLNDWNENEKLPLSRQKRVDGFRSCTAPESKVYFIASPENDIDGIAEKCGKLIQEKLLPDHVDAVIAKNDNLAAILMKELLTRGIRIPQDFGLIGFDNRLIGKCLPVTLSSLYYDKKELADSVLKILLDKIAGKTDPVRVICKMNFIPRESTDKNFKLTKHYERKNS